MLLVLFVLILSSGGCLAQTKFPPGLFYTIENGYPDVLNISVSSSGEVTGMVMGTRGTGWWDERIQKLTVARNRDDLSTWQMYIMYLSYSDTGGSPLLAGWFVSFRATGATAARSTTGIFATQVKPEYPIAMRGVTDIKTGSWSVNANGVTGTLEILDVRFSTGVLERAYIFGSRAEGYWNFNAKSIYFITHSPSNTTVAQIFTGYLYSWLANGRCMQGLSGMYLTNTGPSSEYGWTATIEGC